MKASTKSPRWASVDRSWMNHWLPATLPSQSRVSLTSRLVCGFSSASSASGVAVDAGPALEAAGSGRDSEGGLVTAATGWVAMAVAAGGLGAGATAGGLG